MRIKEYLVFLFVYSCGIVIAYSQTQLRESELCQLPKVSFGNGAVRLTDRPTVDDDRISMSLRNCTTWSRCRLLHCEQLSTLYRRRHKAIKLEQNFTFELFSFLKSKKDYAVIMVWPVATPQQRHIVPFGISSQGPPKTRKLYLYMNRWHCRVFSRPPPSIWSSAGCTPVQILQRTQTSLLDIQHVE